VHAGEDRPAEFAVGPGLGALPGERLGHVEDDRHGQHVVLTGHAHQRGAAVRLEVGRVDHGEPAGGEPLARDVVERVEGLGRRGLVVLVVGDQAAEVVGGEHLGGLEVGAGEGRLARAGDAHQSDERELGDLDHAVTSDRDDVNRASWVGEPVASSTSPTGRSATE
jgi:hypothetical protein